MYQWWRFYDLKTADLVLIERHAKQVEQALEIIVGEEGDADFALVLG